MAKIVMKSKKRTCFGIFFIENYRKVIFVHVEDGLMLFTSQNPILLLPVLLMVSL